jgi:hypothetical protein
MDKILEPCRRTAGGFRAYFNTKEEARGIRSRPGELACVQGRHRTPLSQMLALSPLPARVVGAGPSARHGVGELVSSRRNFIQVAVALALVSAVPSLPLNGWESFLIELRSRIMCLANDGFLVHDLVISPEQDGKRMVQVWVPAIVRS